MSERPIWVAEAWTVTELLNAGWMQADLDWERAMADGVAAIAADDMPAAKELTAQCVQLARAHFDADDPRLATSLANYGICLKTLGRTEDGERLLQEARALWDSCDTWVENMTAPRAARSSLFHLRMEQKHRATYEERWRVKWRELVSEARDCLGTPASAEESPAVLAQGAAERWTRERPAMLNDTRKLMAAALLLLRPVNSFKF